MALSDYIIKKCNPNGEITAKGRLKAGRISGVICIFCNVLLFAAKLVAGILFSSVSVIADAVNNLSDAASNIVMFLGFKMAAKPADREHPYGHGRYEYVSALIISVVILVVGVELFKSGIEKIIGGESAVFSYITVGVLAASIAVKGGMWAFNYRLGRKINSETVRAAAIDSLNDVLATAAVLISLIVSRYIGFDLDGYMAIAVAAFIIFGGVGLIRQALSPLLGKAPDGDLVERIRKRVLSYDGVTGAHDLMVHDYGPGRQFASVHVEIPASVGIVKAHAITDEIERDFLRNDGLHMVVHLDPIEEHSEILIWLEKLVGEAYAGATVHDLNVVRDGCRCMLDFDCLLPDGSDLDGEEVKKALSERIFRERGYFCDITVDYAFDAMPH